MYESELDALPSVPLDLLPWDVVSDPLSPVLEDDLWDMVFGPSAVPRAGAARCRSRGCGGTQQDRPPEAPATPAAPSAVLMGRIEAAEGLITQLAAEQAEHLAALYRLRCGETDPAAPRHGVDPDAWVPPEVAVTLGVSTRQVRRRMLYADALFRYPALRRLVHSGGVASFTALVAAEGLDDLRALVSPDALARIESELVDWLAADRPTVGAVGRRLQALMLDAKARARVTTDDTAARDHRYRQVRVMGLGDGTADLWARLPETDALAVAAALRELGRRPVDATDRRSAAQRRADVLVGRLTGAPAVYGCQGDVPAAHRDVTVTTRIDVTVPVTTLTGPGPAPGHAQGHGPVPAVTCRDLGAQPGTGFRAVLYDSRDGRLLGLAPTGDLRDVRWLTDTRPAPGYQHPTTMADLIHTRDRTCRHPGCTRPADRGDIDHITPHPRGDTSPENAASLCRFHHRLKTHAPGWTVTGNGTGPLLWRTPTGHTASTRPHDHRPPTTAADDDPPPF